MASSRTAVESFDWSGVWMSVGKSKGIVDVMNVASGHTKILLYLGWSEDECFGHEIGESWTKFLNDAKNVLDVCVFFLFPR